jgi:uncharacterized surface protein with fasciclin (FAS1) repeats
MKRIALPALVLAGTFVLGACTDTPMDPVPASFSMEAPSENRSSAAVRGAPAPGSLSIAEIAIDAGFSELVGALAYVDAELGAGLVDLFLNGRDQYTVFAPTNDAFENLYDFLSAVSADRRDLRPPPELVLDVLLYHVVEGRRAANSVVPPSGPGPSQPSWVRPSQCGRNRTITRRPSGLRNDAKILSADISASNGIIHVIDTGHRLPLEN